MRDRPTAGILPMYLELYDRTRPEMRTRFEPFLDRIAERLAAQGIASEKAPVCRTRPEFETAISDLERADVDCLATVHLAYSPSLESLDALLASPLPIVVLDTTMDAAFGPDTPAERIMFNHGIHGVMDMTAMLRRNARPYAIAAGHVDDERFARRAAALVRGARCARAMRRMRALRFGAAFEGMGDFAVEEDVLRRRLGVEVRRVEPSALFSAFHDVADRAVEEEIDRDRQAFDIEADEKTHAASARIGLAMRRFVDEADCRAATFNFLDFNDPAGPPLPFLEVSKAMARGVGFGGEGDILTASFHGALAASFPAASFTEIFCPDWQGQALFLSHMGEISPAILHGRPRLVARDFPFTQAPRPAMLTGPMRPGPATFANLAPGPGDTFSMMAVRVEVLPEGDNPSMADAIRAWVRPALPVADFLETYSRHGATHHSAIVPGDCLAELAAFAGFMQIEYREVG